MRPRDAAAEAYVALGSNLGARESNLRQALSGLESLAAIEGLSGVYETDPVGLEDQPRFLNMVVRCRAPLDPREWVRACLEIERQMGRARSFRNAPRVIDLDVLLVGERVVSEPGVEVPHPRMMERAFVLVPLLELDPGVVDPRTGRPFRERLDPHLDAGAAGIDRIMSGEELLGEE